MKQAFSWYIKPTDEEIKKIWAEGTLTVDTNVLLDLYRYHEETRNSLLSSLSNFQKIWLSHQVTEEFFRNRNKVIVSSKSIFDEATKTVQKISTDLENTVAQLKGNRIIPSTVAENLISSISPIIEEAKQNIAKAKENYPNYLQNDPILNQLVEIFDGKLGVMTEVTEELKHEAERRKVNQIPPGYLDNEKEGDKPYGDFFLWNQILQYAKDNKTSIIFVTTEQKEDWWEKIKGQTTSPRPELLREFYDVSDGQRILIYQTERFLQYAAEQKGEKVDSSVVEEIRAIGSQRAEKENAVEVIGQSEFATNSSFLQRGELKIRLKRPVRNLTGSGHFQPQMNEIPVLTVKLKNYPENMPERYSVTSGAGTEYDFNVHAISKSSNFLPIGEYVFEYSAKCESQDDLENTDAV